MFPKPEDHPSCGVQVAVHACIALYVASDLLLPEAGVRLRRCRMLGTTVPETAIHEYCDTHATKHEIRLARQTHPEPVSQTFPPQRRAEQALGLCISSADSRHAAAPLFARHDIGHRKAVWRQLTANGKVDLVQAGAAPVSRSSDLASQLVTQFRTEKAGIVDRRHLTVVRPKHARAFELLPIATLTSDVYTASRRDPMAIISAIQISIGCDCTLASALSKA
jgi:hypothetical protein